ncbi:MAG: type IX secretion system protein PorQ [Bacteroidales bacterium]|nr:type IX secretion system protein PorQ [Bacteroidales bacterium]
MKRFIYTFAAFLMSIATLQVSAQVANGTYRALTDANSARVVALGGLPLPVHDGDLQTAVFNPSAISPEMNDQMSLSYVGDFNLGTNFGSVQYSHTFEKLGSFAASVQYYNYGNMAYTSESGYADGSTFNVSDYALTLGWGRELTDKWSIGANLKYAGLQYEVGRAGAIGVDVAATYWAYSDWAVTLTARNIGRQIFSKELYLDNKWLPFSLDLMASKKLNHLPLTIMMGYKDMQHWTKTYADPLDLAGYYDPITGEYNEPSKVSQFFTNLGCHLVFGGELALGKNLFLRASYNYETHYNMDVPQKRSLVGFSAGFGLKIKAFQIDYARSRSNIVGSPNFLTIRVDLSKL